MQACLNTALQACQATSFRSACGSSWNSTVSSFVSCCRIHTWEGKGHSLGRLGVRRQRSGPASAKQQWSLR